VWVGKNVGDETRVASFGTESPLDLPFPVAVKTGTSKGFRDNWTVGYTDAVTVAVWVGNFDGSPMLALSGAPAPARCFTTSCWPRTARVRPIA
jgi:penicillin-binding protein 1C